MIAGFAVGIYVSTMEIMLSERDALPLYQQIVAQIRFYIASQMLYPYEELPSTRVAAKEWGVSYHTVRKAYNELARAALVYSKPPGLFYVSPKIESFRPSIGQRNAFIKKIIHDAKYLYGLDPVKLCRKIEEWDDQDTNDPPSPWPESAGQDGRSD